MPAPAAAATSTPSPARRARAEPRGRFEDALRRAEEGRQPRAPVQRQVRPPGRSLTGRRPEAPATAPSPTPVALPSLTAPPGIPELQAALRAAPPAIVTAAPGAHAAQLSLGFGAALSVDLRAGAQGLELSLRPAPTLEKAARAELPRLVEALRARGLRVSRAEVRAAPAAQPPSHAR